MSDPVDGPLAGTMLLDPAVVSQPFGFYEQLRREAPVWRVPGTNVVVASSFEAVTEILGRIDDFSNIIRNTLYRDDDGLPRQYPLMDENSQVLASADPPIHTVHRRAVFPSLVAKRMAAIEPDVRTLARDALGDFINAGRGNFMRSVAHPIPITVISWLIGFRRNDPETLLRAALDSTRIVGATASREQLEQIFLDSLDVAAWIADEIAQGGAPDDVLLGTVAQGIATGDLTADEGGVILQTLLSAGGESTSSLLGNAVFRLAADEPLQELLRAEPALVPTFVEEVLRLESPFRQQMRSVPRDTSLLGVDIPAGSTVIVFFAAANRDPVAYADADRLRLDRETPKFHLAFGRGIHHCVGAPLARLEANVVVTELLASTSSVRLDPELAPQRAYNLLVWRFDELPLVVE